MAGLRTEYAFTLPKGFVDAQGALHRHGTMRLATARDEIEPLRDPRVTGPDDPYLTLLVLARVITQLGPYGRFEAEDVESFFAADLAFLQDLYGIVNFGNPADVATLQQSVLVNEEPVWEIEEVEDAEPEVEPIDDFDDFDDPADDDPGPVEPTAPLRRRDQIEEVPGAARR
jgi:hypothetical protein